MTLHSIRAKSLYVLCFFLSIVSLNLFAKEKEPVSKVKFGEVKPEDFDPALYSFDSTADAVVLYDRGYSYFRESRDGWFILVFERHKRIKVVTKNGLDAANFVIQQYKNSKDEEKITMLKGMTFNLENGQVVSTPLEKGQIFKDQLSKNWSVTKFGLPNVKEGSIIDVTYEINSDFFFNLQGWEFQGAYPRVHSEYTTRIPDFFNYVMLSQGYIPYTSKNSVSKFTRFTLMVPGATLGGAPQRVDLPSNETESTWVIENVPSMKQEAFTTTLDNHISKIEFQLSEYRFPDQAPVPKMANWFQLGDGLMKDEQFGFFVGKQNGWLNDDIAIITKGMDKPEDRARALYAYLRDKFSLTSSGGVYLTDNLRNIWKNMKGRTSDANLMLVALMNAANIKAEPVILSTRDNGRTNSMYPLINQYNYVVCRIEINGVYSFLDASDPLMGYGKLPLECYNGHSRVISAMPTPVDLSANSIMENKVTVINLFNQADSPWVGTVSSKPGYYESESIRSRVKASGQSQVGQDVRNSLPAESELKDFTIEGVEDLDNPVSIKYKMDLSALSDEDVIYINPLMGEKQKENPFKAADRKYPVEMPYTFKEMVISNIMVPEGFDVDEMPKATRVKLENDQGMFEYLIQKNESMIQLRSTVELKYAEFASEEYQTLRSFFTLIVNKQAEQIVFKKKN